jgi:MoxR-like ATPase
MYELKDLGALCVAEVRQGSRVPVAITLSVGEFRIPAPENPRLLLVPANVTCLQQMWDAIRMPSRNNLLITGESGSGKTSLMRYLGEIYRHVLLKCAEQEYDPVHAAHIIERASAFQTRILTFHENLRRSDITERRHYGETGEEKTGWTMSDVMDGMVAGDWNVLSEINRTGEDVQAEFNEPLENKAKSLHRQIIRGHPDARFIATTNPVKSEGRGIYEGRVMSGEFMNRFTNKVHLRYLPHDQEFEILKDYGPDVSDKIIDRLVALANDIRRDYAEEHGVVPFPVTTRALIRIVRHLQQFPDDRHELRSLFWRKAYWLDDRIHPPVAKRLVENLLDLHDITDQQHQQRDHSRVTKNEGKGASQLLIGGVSHPVGPGGPYVPDTVIEEVGQNITDLEWILKDIVLNENILLIGEAGVGKNKLESYLAHLLSWNLLVIGMSGETRVSDLLTYRSFGEEEEGRTGDTATLGLQALTDDEHNWIIVLDEANKAHPGVLVSFNDLLQDRKVRLPGGTEVPVRAAICVNINPNRPPYEVNDFSFEFMDRFSIHTIVHLPPGEAAGVLKKKYPSADIDFIKDVVNGFYSLHPLYSGGVLFEPVTMRNEEAAIERGLQYPDRACNLTDLICSCYGPRDGRELKAMRSTLETAGFDRSVLAAERALEQFRESWENDKESEGKALALAGTYRVIGKPTAALDIHREMIARHFGRDWVHHLISAWILLDSHMNEEAEAEIRKGFAAGSILHLNNNVDYLVLSSEVHTKENKLVLSLEVLNRQTGSPALIVSRQGTRPVPSFRRSTGEFFHAYTDSGHNLSVYEAIPIIKTVFPGTSGLNDTRQAGIESPAGPGWAHSSLSHLVGELITLGWQGTDIHSVTSRFPSPPWSVPAWKDGVLIREISRDNTCIRLCSNPVTGWTAELRSDSYTDGDDGLLRIGWRKDATTGNGELFYSCRDGKVRTIPAMTDPFLHCVFYEREKTLLIVLSDNYNSIPADAGDRSENGQGLHIRVVPHREYRDTILSPLISCIQPRLDHIFRYTRPLQNPGETGAGDCIYTIQPDSRVTISLVTGVDGIRHVYTDLTAATMNTLHGQAPGPEGDSPDPDPLLRRVYIPYSGLDDCENWQEQAFSPDTQSWLQEIRAYIASTLFERTRPREPAYEAKARAILSEYIPLTEPVGAGTSVLCRGDILVRTDNPGQSPNRLRSVFVVRFPQESTGGTSDGSPVVRGFWLGESNPVATERLDIITSRFGRIIVDGDDTHARIVRQLAREFHLSSRPWNFSRTGTRSDPVDRFEFGELSLEFQTMDRRFRFILNGSGDKQISIEETGYPTASATVSTGGRDHTRWQGSVIGDIRYLRESERVIIIISDELWSGLVHNGLIEKDAYIGDSGITFEFRGSSGAERP